VDNSQNKNLNEVKQFCPTLFPKKLKHWLLWCIGAADPITSRCLFAVAMALSVKQPNARRPDAKPENVKRAKAKPVSKVARGKRAKVTVFRGWKGKVKTSGGLTKEMLFRNKRGRIVSKKHSAHGTRGYKNIRDWVDAVMEARANLRVEGFCAINGKSITGKAIFVRARAIRAARRCLPEA